jgi:uncharacterized membrane protein
MRWWPALLALAFPLLAHAAAATGATAPAVAALACLILLLCWPLRERPGVFVGALAACAALLAWLVSLDRAALPLLFPPVLLTAAFGLYFARSLRAGRTPLIERIVRALHGDATPAPDVLAYARRVTWLWAALLIGLAAINLVLAALATPGGWLLALGLTPPLAVSDAQWSLFANLLNYVIIALAFVAEYAWRRHRFPQQPYRDFADFLGRVARLGPAFWRQT